MRTLHNFFRSDLTGDAEFLKTLPVGEISDDHKVSLAAMMGEADATPEGLGEWTADGEGEYSLAGAEVFYNGANNDDLPTHPLFGNVVGIRLADDAEGPRRVYLNYNTP